MIDTVIEAIQDPALFRPLFKDLATWGAWQTFLKALFALPMKEDDLILYRRCTGRQRPPRGRFVKPGVQPGFDPVNRARAALVGCYLACFRDYGPYLAAGERAMILIIAADRYQAQNIFRYVKGFLASNPMLSRLVGWRESGIG